MMFQEQVTRLLRAFGGASAEPRRPTAPSALDWFDDDLDEAAPPDEGVTMARVGESRANYPLGVTG